MYFAARREVSEKMLDYFIFFPPGYNETEVDEVVDISGYWDKKISAMNSHLSQKHDIDKIIPIMENLPKNELFFITEK